MQNQRQQLTEPQMEMLRAGVQTTSTKTQQPRLAALHQKALIIKHNTHGGEQGPAEEQR